MILILGAGFLGTALYARLVREGHQTRVFSRSPSARVPGMICGDINEIAAYDETFDDVDTIIHTIHTTVPASAHGNPRYDFESNVLPLVRLLDVAKTHDVSRFIYLSSG